MKILATDGIDPKAQKILEKKGFTVLTTKVAQEQLASFINKESIEILLVRSATKVRKDLIDAVDGLKVIGRGGVGMDNIDVDYARSKKIKVINTPSASSISVAEMVFAHIFSLARNLQKSNRSMPLEGDSKFSELKKSYAKAIELRGKVLGIIGMGSIGREVARLGIGLGMQILFYSRSTNEVSIELIFFDGQTVRLQLKSSSLETVLKQSDFVSLHVPYQDKPIISEQEFALMKPTAGLINTARGGAIDESALLQAINNKTLAYAGLDVFEQEPKPSIKLLMQAELSLSPHMAGATMDAQERIGTDLAQQIMVMFGKN